ncbi:Hpt domain-containing protein [Uliginosibacterium sp. 31-16]|uniref:Hpt domain-containing protein n=1 Tax=Uliginosibacterium sp. 31-16 TaxID=3068315 RepID=UPI00273F7A49|nr:Hpt domain-containing protein [Uliginosibacterium sp. 31-16]MDP5240938.1 Hpt domain-containing protein [Uliginosibacterium sp. 31-16]
MSLSLPSDSSIFNRQWILEQIGGDEGLLREIATVFLTDGPDIRQRLLAALRAGDSVALHATAHCAKSAVGNFGSEAAVLAAVHLEDAAKNGETASFAILTDTLCQALIEVEDALRQEVS